MKPGLYENIRKKKARIKAQKASGAKKVERMRKPGSEGAPSAEDFKNAAKTAKDGEDDKKDKLVGPLKERLQMLKDKKKSKGERRMDPGHYRMNGAECKKCGKKRSSCSMCDKKKDGGMKMSPYADGMGCGRKDVGDAINEILIREDKPCGGSFIAENKKCTKQTTLRPPTKKRKARGKNYAAGAAKGLLTLAGAAGAYGAIQLGANAITEQVNQSRKRKSFINEAKYAKAESSRKYGQAKATYNQVTGYNNSKLNDPSVKARANKWAEQDLKEARLKRTMARTEIKMALRRAKNTFPKSAARSRAS